MASASSACTPYELYSKESGKSYGNQPLSICDESFTPLEVRYDLEAARSIFTRKAIEAGPEQYVALPLGCCPIPEGFEPDLPVGFTPLVKAKNLGGAPGLNQSVC